MHSPPPFKFLKTKKENKGLQKIKPSVKKRPININIPPVIYENNLRRGEMGSTL
jgi:hypothetical protein